MKMVREYVISVHWMAYSETLSKTVGLRWQKTKRLPGLTKHGSKASRCATRLLVTWRVDKRSSTLRCGTRESTAARSNRHTVERMYISSRWCVTTRTLATGQTGSTTKWPSSKCTRIIGSKPNVERILVIGTLGHVLLFRSAGTVLKAAWSNGHRWSKLYHPHRSER